MSALDLLDIALVLAAAVAFALGSVRAIRGPQMVDRVIALDMITVAGVAFAALSAKASGSRAFLDVGLGIALLGFIATIAFARMIERMPRDRAVAEAVGTERREDRS